MITLFERNNDMSNRKYVIKKLPEGKEVNWDEVEKAPIDNAPWKGIYKTEVTAFAQVVALPLGLAVKLTCKQSNPMRACVEENGDVWKDDCLEFFVMPNEETGVYYNFECNSNGIMLVGKGKERNGREHPSVMGGYKMAFNIVPTIGENEWSLTYMIPYGFFGPLGKMKGNFYKCEERDEGKMHFQCWNNIEAEKPDFHRPEFFGDLEIL